MSLSLFVGTTVTRLKELILVPLPCGGGASNEPFYCNMCLGESLIKQKLFA